MTKYMIEHVHIHHNKHKCIFDKMKNLPKQGIEGMGLVRDAYDAELLSSP